MRKLIAALALCIASLHMACALTPDEKKLVDEARAKYYNLQASGFDSLACDVSFELSDAPFAELPHDTKDSLRAAHLSLKLDDAGRPFVTALPATSSPTQAKQMLSVMSSLISGVFQTWTTKGLFGPIPPFDSQIKSVKTTAAGYIFDLNVPGAPVLVTTDKNFVTEKISSIGGMTIESTTYLPSAHGLVFAGNQAINKNPDGSQIEVSYSLTTQEVSGLIIPYTVHVIVKPNIDSRYTLRRCQVSKAKVINIR